jgi:hypothetical protein
MLLPVDESFAKSCGQVRPILLKVASPQGDKTAKFVINKPFAFVGSNLNCDVCLPMPSVSKRHVYLQLMGGRLYCVDQASREGMFWGQRQRLFGWLDVGQTLRIGPYELSLLEPAGAIPCAAEHASNQAPILVEEDPALSSYAALQINETLTFPLQRQLTIIGRSKYCHLELEHNDLSRVHASLLRTPDGRYWIVDLMSRSGVKLNGIRCSVSHLQDGDVIKIGNYALHFKCKQPVVTEALHTETAAIGKPESTPTFSMPAASVFDSAQSSDPLPRPTESSSPVTSATAPPASAAPPPQTLEDSASLPLIPLQEGKLIKTRSGQLVRPAGALAKKKDRLVASPASVPAELQLVTTLLQQMQQMQQEMFHQMRMSMEMMSHYINTMQQDQREIMRRELQQIHQLNDELLELKRQAATPAKRPGKSTAPRRSAPQDSIEERSRPFRKALPRALPIPVPADLADPAATARQEEVAAQALGLRETPLPAPIPEDAATQDHAAAQSHVWISKRIANLESERLTRWQRMMSKIMGR